MAIDMFSEKTHDLIDSLESFLEAMGDGVSTSDLEGLFVAAFEKEGMERAAIKLMMASHAMGMAAEADESRREQIQKQLLDSSRPSA